MSHPAARQSNIDINHIYRLRVFTLNHFVLYVLCLISNLSIRVKVCLHICVWENKVSTFFPVKHNAIMLCVRCETHSHQDASWAVYTVRCSTIMMPRCMNGELLKPGDVLCETRRLDRRPPARPSRPLHRLQRRRDRVNCLSSWEAPPVAAVPKYV